MTINQRQTVYRRDYVWPNTKGLSTLQPPPIEVFCLCKCPHSEIGGGASGGAGGGGGGVTGAGVANANASAPSPAPADKDQGWSRIGPMGPLIEPKLYPAHVGASPQSDVSRFNQPNVFLNKLQSDYPLLFECEERAPVADFVARVNRDRMRTIYQVDYCKPGAPFTYQNLFNADDYGMYPPPRRLPGDPKRRPSLRNKRDSLRSSGGDDCDNGPNEIDGNQAHYKNAAAAVKANQNQCANLKICKGGALSATTGNTEYMDRISKMATKKAVGSANK